MVNCQNNSSIGHRTKFRRLHCSWVIDRCTSIMVFCCEYIYYVLHYMGMQFGWDLILQLCKIYPLLSQVRWSKQQPMVHLDIGVYLRNREIRTFTLLDFLRHLFPLCPSALGSPGPSVPLPPGGGCLSGKDRQKVLSGDVVPLLTGTSPRCQQPRFLVIPSLHAVLWSPGSFPAFRIFSSVGIFTAFFPHPPAPRFPHLNSQCAEANKWSAHN